jgi:3-deoxy-7-phosphoheptulonate synthase
MASVDTPDSGRSEQEELAGNAAAPSRASEAPTRDTHVSRFDPLDPPGSVITALPLSNAARQNVTRSRQELRAAMSGTDDRIVVITGPCSIHDPDSALDYATRLAALQRELQDKFIIVMRTYFEKPRTTIGWKGLIYDPVRDESHDMNRGLRDARRILLAINELGLGCATEFLDPIVPQYTADLVAWAAIGARTTESQTHRQMASGLSMPVGFKNATDGGLQTALDAMLAATHAQSFLGIDPEGRTSIVRTRGNPDVHIILRGGSNGANYTATHVRAVRQLLHTASAGRQRVLIDCSHGNSGKDYRKQPLVFDEVMAQVASGERGILGVMLESHLVEGRQTMAGDLVYGQSITDACIGWDQTESVLRQGHRALSRSTESP